MKKITRILSSLVAAATLASGVGSVATSATTYDPCDANHDGVVDVRDVAAISQFLNGNLCEPEYSRLDTNKNLVVDDQDVQCVMARITGKTYSIKYYSKKTGTTYIAPSVSTYTYDDSADDLSSRKCVKYKYSTHTTSNYTLYPSQNVILNSSLKKASLKSAQDTGYYYPSSGTEATGIVRIGTNETNMGTGFVVGDHVIATSAHNVYGDNGWKSSVSVKLYNSSGYPSGATLTPVEAHVPETFITNENDNFDYALITVSQNLSGYTHFALGNSYNVNSTDYANIPIHVTGGVLFGGKLYTGEDRIWGSNNTSNLNYNCDVYSGNSGSPVYVITKHFINGVSNYTYTALGINGENTNTTTHNSGVLITKYLNQFYLNNSNINY